MGTCKEALSESIVRNPEQSPKECRGIRRDRPEEFDGNLEEPVGIHMEAPQESHSMGKSLESTGKHEEAKESTGETLGTHQAPDGGIHREPLVMRN